MKIKKEMTSGEILEHMKFLDEQYNKADFNKETVGSFTTGIITKLKVKKPNTHGKETL